MGRNLKSDSKDVLAIKDPDSVGLRKVNLSSSYIFAKSDTYFLYPNNYNYYNNFIGILSNMEGSHELSSVIRGLTEKELIKSLSKENDKEPAILLFSLYESGVKKGFILHNNALSSIKFQNIISVACFLVKFKWALKFIQNYKNLVPELEREGDIQFAKIKIFYGQMEYEKVLQMLNRFRFTFFSLKMQSRWYSLIVNFITFNSLEFIISKIDGFV